MSDSAVMALVMPMGGLPESELLQVDLLDPETVTVRLPDGTLWVVEAAELRRAIAPERAEEAA